MSDTLRPNVSIVSPFRQNGAAYVDEYFKRAYSLTYPARLRWVCVEGDSTDDTPARLMHYGITDTRVKLVKCDTGAPRYGSEVSPERFKVLAKVFNAGLDAVDLEWSDYVMFLPSDVTYEPSLIDRLAGWNCDLIAPMFWATEATHGRFYDIWGFWHEGKSFHPTPPAWYEAHYPQDEPLKMDTIGGCILMRKEVVASGCRYSPEEVDHGLCKQAQAKGFEVYCDLHTHIFHP